MPDALREAGAVVHVMADVYGERIGQGLADEEWLHDAGEHGWVVLMKDAKIRYRPAELQVVIDHGLRAFCLTNANLRGARDGATVRRAPAADHPHRRAEARPVHLRRVCRERATSVAAGLNAGFTPWAARSLGQVHPRSSASTATGAPPVRWTGHTDREHGLCLSIGDRHV